MDGVTNSEGVQGASGTKSNILLVSIVGVVVGMLIGAGAVAYFFRGSIFLSIPGVEGSSALSYPDGKVPGLSSRTNIVLPKKMVSEEYYLLINKIISDLQRVGASNNETILPLISTVKQRSAAGNFNGIIDFIIQARDEISNNSDLLATISRDIASLTKINETSTLDADLRNQTVPFLVSADAFVRAFADYFSVLNETLSGSLPTQDLLNTLSGKVTSVQNAGSSLQSELTTLLKLIDQKNKASMP